MAAGEELGLTGVAITNSIKDCKAMESEISQPICLKDIELVGGDLADASTKFLSAVKVCQGSDKAKCTKALSEVSDEINTASTDFLNFIR